MGKISYYISTNRIPTTYLTSEAFTKFSITIKDEVFLELIDGKKRTKVKTLFNPETEEKIIIVK
jgi:hypothetical protein